MDAPPAFERLRRAGAHTDTPLRLRPPTTDVGFVVFFIFFLVLLLVVFVGFSVVLFVDELPFRAFWRTRAGGAEGAGGTDGEEKPKKLARDISTMIPTKVVWQFTGSLSVCPRAWAQFCRRRV